VSVSLVAGERNQLKLRSPEEDLASQVQLVAGKQLNLVLCAVAHVGH